MSPDDVRASRVEWITAYLKSDPSLLREVLEGLGATVGRELYPNPKVYLKLRLPEEET